MHRKPFNEPRRRKSNFGDMALFLYNYTNKETLNGEEKYISYNKWIFLSAEWALFVCVAGVKSKASCKEGDWA